MNEASFDVSVVVCTRDRPESLGKLLHSLRRQESGLRFEIIVVDNSSLSRQRVQGDPGVPVIRWLSEPRPGLSYARNTGIAAARAPVVAFADDDMELPPLWLETLVRPLFDGQADAVTGLTVPQRTETEAERLFEAYGGHGYSSGREIYGPEWLARFRLHLPLWRVGGLGNAAVLRVVFDRIGFFEEALGAGSPAGSWEDLDLLYRMLVSGHRILHEPLATARHAHREQMDGLREQLCAYRRGEVCFCLIALARHRDGRGLTHCLLWIPVWRLQLLLAELGRRLRGERLFHFPLMASEIRAYLGAPAALFESFARKRRLRLQNPNQR